MEDRNEERHGTGRRPYDQGCLLHREEMDVLQDKVSNSVSESSKTSGRFTAMLWFLGVIGSILSIGMITLITKTSDIQTLLNKNDVVLMQHTERIETLRKDVDDIKTRNRYVDQQGNMKTIIDKSKEMP